MNPSGFDFDAAVAAPFRMQPGLRRLADGARQLTALATDGPAFAEKFAVLRQAPEAALLCAPGFDAEPALRALAAEAARQCPGVLSADAQGVTAARLGCRIGYDGRLLPTASAAHVGAAACLAQLPPARRLAALLSLALHEDFALVDGRSATLPWMAVCLPSHWSPAEKIGRSFAEVHAPVADNATLLAAARHLMRLVCEPQRWERFVWTITPHASHDQHPARHAPRAWPREAAAVVRLATWRTEHQTFIPLPALQQAVFTIHVDVQPLTQAVDTPARAAALHAALTTMSDAVLAYRGLGDARAALLTWLAERAGR